MEPAQLGIFELYSMYQKARAALAIGDLSTLAKLAGDLLHEAAKILPKGNTPTVAAPESGPLMPLTMPSPGTLFDLLDKAISFAQMLKALFGK